MCKLAAKRGTPLDAVTCQLNSYPSADDETTPPQGAGAFGIPGRLRSEPGGRFRSELLGRNRRNPRDKWWRLGSLTHVTWTVTRSTPPSSGSDLSNFSKVAQ